jgi:hypothetical protein
MDPAGVTKARAASRMPQILPQAADFCNVPSFVIVYSLRLRRCPLITVFYIELPVALDCAGHEAVCANVQQPNEAGIRAMASRPSNRSFSPQMSPD